ncbi:MAG: stage II sporulation protein M [Bacilli bacterium]
MKKIMSFLKNETKKNKKVYIFLFVLFIIGVIFGSLFITILDNPDKTLILDQVSSFFDQIKNNTQLSFKEAFSNSVTGNMLYIVLIWILGLSIIGIPIILFMLFIRGFILGFSIGTIILKYKLLGILGAGFYVFPHHIIFSILSIVLSYYAFSLSLMIFISIIKKRNINFKSFINKYLKVLLYSFITVIIVSLIEIFISPLLIKLFLFIFD